MKKTLLQINVTANWGSTGKIAEDIGNLVQRNGWRSVIAYGRHMRPSDNELIRVGSDFDIKEHALESRLVDNSGLASRRATREFIAKIEVLKPDVIHLHNIHGYYLNYKMLFQYLAGKSIPIVWTMHDCWPFTGHCGYFDYARCEKWETGCLPPCPCKGDYPRSVLLSRSHNNWVQKRMYFTSVKKMTMVPVSEWLGGLVRQSYLGGYPVQVIHNGIDTGVFCPQKRECYALSASGRKRKNIVLGVASVWERRKGLADFVRLRELLTDEYEIVLVGVSEEQKKKLPQGITGIKRTQNQNELAQLYSAAMVFVNPTYEDNFPTTNIEALACGTPVITYRTGGSTEAVDTDTGIIVEQGDVVAIAKAIHHYRGLSVVESNQLSVACRNRAEVNFNKDMCFANYLRLYDSII